MRRAVLGVAWTLGLAVGLWTLDRMVLGPDRDLGWRRLGAAAELPERLPVPPWLPASLGWPPDAVWVSDAPPAAWGWLGSAEGAGVWLGVGAPPPPARSTYEACLGEEGCPPGWHLLSRRLPDGRELVVLGDARAEVLARILELTARAAERRP